MNYQHIYPTWASFLDQVTNGKRTAPECSRYASLYGDDEWAGASMSKALHYLHEGWPQGLARIQQLKQTLPPNLFDAVMPITDYKPELRHQLAGGVVDVAAFVSGSTPDCFINEVTPIDDGDIKQGNKVQTVYINVSNSANENKDGFFYRGAYSYLMIEHLELCGYSTEVWALQTLSGVGSHSNMYIKLKELGELLDIHRLSVALSAPFFLRRLVFAAHEMNSVEERTALGFGLGNLSYGRALSPNIEEIALEDDTKKNPIWISTINESDPKRMLAKFRAILKEWVERRGMENDLASK